MFHNTKYSLLPPDGYSRDQETSLTGGRKSGNSLRLGDITGVPALLFWGCIGALFLTTLNLALLPSTLSETWDSVQKNVPFPTVYPDAYIGLDRVSKLLPQSPDFSHPLPYSRQNGSLFDHNILFPRLIARVNSRYPDVAYYDSMINVSKGVVISGQDSVIMQFFVPGEGTAMTCTIAGFRPVARDDIEGDLIDHRGDINALEVWNVTGREKLDPSSITYAHRPPRTNYIGRLDFSISPNMTTPTFPCPMGQYQTVELRCQRWECFLKFEETFTPPMLGFALVRWTA